jgi:hypothetical protein
MPTRNNEEVILVLENSKPFSFFYVNDEKGQSRVLLYWATYGQTVTSVRDETVRLCCICNSC